VLFRSGRFLTQLTGLPVVVSLLIISSIAVFFCMVLLYQISRDLFPGQGIARGSILCLVLFPSAFFLFGIFPQSLALLWILLAYHQAQRDHWLAAGLAGLLAGLTHFTAIPLALLLAVQSLQALRGSRFSLRWPALLSVPVFPLLGIAIFLVWREWMGYPSMISFQNQNWGRNFSPPWNIVSNLLHYFLANWPPNWVLLFNSIIFLLAIISAVWGIRHLPLSLNVYQITLLFVILSYSSKTGDPLGSFNRYILLQFPMMIAFGSLRLGHYARLAIFGFCLLVSLGVSAMFFMWKWVG
jgi:hypothetical protein